MKLMRIHSWLWGILPAALLSGGATFLWAGDDGVAATGSSRAVRVLRTESGVQFGVWGDKPDSPSLTLFVLASTIQETLWQSYYRQSGNILGERLAT